MEFPPIPKPELLPGMTESTFECVREGLTIRGTHYRPEGENLPIAIVSHGFMGCQALSWNYTHALASVGYAAFCYDFCGGSAPGTGLSDGKSTDMSVLSEVKDLEAVIAYARSLPYTSNEVLVMGCSQGGFVSGLAAAKPENAISKLVMFYPALCIPDDARAGRMLFAKFDPSNIPEIIDCGPMLLGRQYAAEMINVDAFEAISPYKGDVLIVHGTDDKVVDVAYGRKAAEAYESTAPGRTKLVIIEDGAHGFVPEHDAIAIDALKTFAK